MRKWFRAKSHWADWVDFQTKGVLYECKSCNLLNGWKNANSRRPFRVKRNVDIRSSHLGRFQIDLENHARLKAEADEAKKKAKYVFVITVGNQRIWRLKPWEDVDSMIKKDKPRVFLHIRDVFAMGG